jgi:hypothetical protein
MKIASVIALATSLTASAAWSQEFPQTRAEHYEVGQRFASCSAYFAYGADVARSAGLEDSAVAIEGMERGWRLAGMFLLVDGLAESRQTETETTFLTLQEIKVDQLKARRELGVVMGNDDPEAWIAEYQEECGPWLPMQQSIIQAMRTAPTS